MKTIKYSTCCFVCCICLEVFGQSSFQDLDFESANLQPTPPNQQGVTIGGLVSVANALPGWTAYLGPTQASQVYQNNETLGGASVDILGPNFYGGGPSPVIEGNYTVVLQPGQGYNGTGFGLIGATLSQTGLIPSGMLSLQFKAETFGSFYVTLGGQNLSLIQLGTGANYIVYGADVSQFAGQSENLTIGVPAAPNTADYFDSFVFSPTAVPEPSSLFLLVSGTGLFAVSRKCFCKK
jgi:hypothetical protein